MTRIRCRELSSDRITGTLKDSTGTVVLGSVVTACELTLWDLESGAPADSSPAVGILNSRQGFDVLGSEEVTISEAGAFVWYVAPEDNAIVNPRRQMERHRATLHFEWTGDVYDGEINVEFEIEVENLRKVA